MPEPVTLVERFVDHASATIERYCGRVFAQQAYREVLLSVRSHYLVLERTPIVGVASITMDGEEITDYRVESADAGLLYRRDGWWLRSPGEWTIDYIGGYILPEQTSPPDAEGELLPFDIQRACLETTKIWWQEREVSDRIASKTLGLTGDSISFRVSANRESIPPLARYSLDPYRRWVMA
jgi:hypothetical protein